MENKGENGLATPRRTLRTFRDFHFAKFPSSDALEVKQEKEGGSVRERVREKEIFGKVYIVCDSVVSVAPRAPPISSFKIILRPEGHSLPSYPPRQITPTEHYVFALHTILYDVYKYIYKYISE